MLLLGQNVEKRIVMMGVMNGQIFILRIFYGMTPISSAKVKDVFLCVVNRLAKTILPIAHYRSTNIIYKGAKCIYLHIFENRYIVNTFGNILNRKEKINKT